MDNLMYQYRIQYQIISLHQQIIITNNAINYEINKLYNNIKRLNPYIDLNIKSTKIFINDDLEQNFNTIDNLKSLLYNSYLYLYILYNYSNSIYF